MPRTTATARDPLAAYPAGAFMGIDRAPMPLARTAISVRILGGIAIVSTVRSFRNVETRSIEATLTFPVPFHATLAGLSAEVGGRTLAATAMPRAEARDAYEEAVDAGATAVLHEELLRGVHQLSVTHIPPRAEVVVRDTWAAPLAARPNGAALVIPVTVGEVYGRSPMTDSDDLITSAAVRHVAELEVVAQGLSVCLARGKLTGGRATVQLDSAIEIELPGWAPRPVAGRTADGRVVSVSVAPAPTGAAPLDLAILVDRSGSMNGGVTVDGGRARRQSTRHELVRAALIAASEGLAPQDAVSLFQYDSEAQQITGRPSATLADLARRLDPPQGGTETGLALGYVLANSDARDILLVTDGKSYALDAHRVARAGRRVSVLLIGDDALEALVGQIAALTGGQVFVAAGADIQAALGMALASMRTAAPPHRSATLSELKEAGTVCGGMMVEASWGTEVPGAASAPDDDARVIGALAAALALPTMDQEYATALAVSHGIVTHLTSLVLVDEAGERQKGLPAQRKVPLMAFAGSPAGYVAASVSLPMAEMNLSMLRSPAARFAEDIGLPARSWTRLLKRIATADLRRLVDAIDWNADPEALLRLDEIIAPRPVIAAIHNASAIPEVTDLADALGQPPHLVVLALLAMAQAKAHRGADRIARSILAKADARLVDSAAASLGLDGGGR